MKKHLLFLFFACCAISVAQTTKIRVCTYNLVNYSAFDENERKEKFQMIFPEIKPDILVLQGIVDTTGNNNVRTAVRTALGFNMFTPEFQTRATSNNSVFYDWNKLRLLHQNYYSIGIRDIAEYKFENRTTLDTFSIFSVYLTDGKGDSTAQIRVQEITNSEFKAQLTRIPDEKMMVVGSLNFYNDDEPGYALLKDSPIMDPIGAWESDSAGYFQYYTESTRGVEVRGTCGVGNGIKNRLDFILFSKSLSSNYVPNSTIVFGNDGEDRRKSSITRPTNQRVNPQMAGALLCGSERMPVYADFTFTVPVVSVNEEENIHHISFKETSETISVNIPSNGAITVADLLGRVVVKKEISNTWLLKRNELQPGVYMMYVQNGELFKSLKFTVTE